MSMPEVIIRPITVSDVSRIIDLEMTYLGETIGSDMLISESTNPTIKFLAIEKNNLLLGYIGCYHILGECEILNFVIDGAFQRRGYGQMLFNELLKQVDAKRVILDVRVNNEQGMKFYLKNGFRKISIRKNYYSDGTDAIVMEKLVENYE
jgi:ribosomal-protein-alanine N-acetyltransferase